MRLPKTAVKDSLKQAREIDMDLVDAQQARRILDRSGGIPDQSGALGESKTRTVSRPCPVSGTSDHLQTEKKKSMHLFRKNTGRLDAVFTSKGREKSSDCEILRNRSEEDDDSL